MTSKLFKNVPVEKESSHSMGRTILFLTLFAQNKFLPFKIWTSLVFRWLLYTVCYSDKLAHAQVVINCRFYIAQMCTCKDKLAHSLGAPCLDDVMNYNLLTTKGSTLRIEHKQVFHNITLKQMCSIFNKGLQNKSTLCLNYLH